MDCTKKTRESSTVGSSTDSAGFEECTEEGCQVLRRMIAEWSRVRGRSPRRSFARRSRVTGRPSPQGLVFGESEAFGAGRLTRVLRCARAQIFSTRNNPDRPSKAEGTSRVRVNPLRPAEILHLCSSHHDLHRLREENGRSRRPHHPGPIAHRHRPSVGHEVSGSRTLPST